MASKRTAVSERLAFEENALTPAGIGLGGVSGIQRARILAAIADVCVERGVANVTVAHVVSRSGVSRRTFYELFVDREDCFLAAFDDAIECVSRQVSSEYDPSAKWVERVRAALTSVLCFLETERSLGWLLVVGSLGAGTAALKRRKHVMSRIVAVIEEGRAETKRGSDPPPLAAEGALGGALAIIHARMLGSEQASLIGLVGPLMAMIVLPYLGQAAARRELEMPVRSHPLPPRRIPADPLRDVNTRLTYRTIRVLMAVADHSGSSNREIARASGTQDQGQISKLLTRLCKLGLIENAPAGQVRGAPNAWVLTPKGAEIERATRVIGQERSSGKADRIRAR